MSDLEIIVLTPSARSPYWGYVNSVEAMETVIRQYGILHHTVKRWERVVQTQCSNLPQGRQALLDMALNENFSHAVFIDDDMAFPPSILNRMIASMYGNPAVMQSPIQPPSQSAIQPAIQAMGINYLRKDPNKAPLPTATAVNGTTLSSAGKTGVDKIGSCGLGLFILDLAAVRAANIQRPHFEIAWDPAAQGYVGEDRFFCGKLRQHGIDIYVDHDSSQLVRHIGDFGYGYNAPQQL